MRVFFLFFSILFRISFLFFDVCDSSCHFEFSLHTFHYLFSTFIHLILRFSFSSDKCGVFMFNCRNGATLKLGGAKTELP